VVEGNLRAGIDFCSRPGKNTMNPAALTVDNGPGCGYTSRGYYPAGMTISVERRHPVNRVKLDRNVQSALARRINAGACL
jgi:hypothetical protein